MQMLHTRRKAEIEVLSAYSRSRPLADLEDSSATAHESSDDVSTVKTQTQPTNALITYLIEKINKAASQSTS